MSEVEKTKKLCIITEAEKKLIIFIFIFYTLLGLAVCFKGMALMTKYNELLKENENLKNEIEILENRGNLE